MIRAWPTLALALAILPVAIADATTYTINVPVTAGGYVDLGAGPLDVGLNGPGPVALALSDSQPPATLLGPILSELTPSKTFCQTSHVWALALRPGGAIVNTNPASCASASGGATIVAPSSGTGAYTAATIGVSDSTIVAAATATKFLDVVNDSQSATVCLNLGATATIAAGVCAAGEITLPPLFHRSWEGSFVPTDAVHAIASAAATPAAVGVK